MKISNANKITSYMHCANCIDQKPAGISPKEWARTQAGFTPIGLQVWCSRCDSNICHIDFEGTKHPANTTRKGRNKVTVVGVNADL